MKRLLCVFRSLIGLAVLALVVVVLLASYAPHVVRKHLASAGGAIDVASKMLAPPLIAAPEINKCFWLGQNWSDEDRAWFHNVSQGTKTLPVSYAWFKQLERPEFSPFDPIIRRPLISDPQYLSRLGFLAPNACDPKPDPSGPVPGYGELPVGFALLDEKLGVPPVTNTGGAADTPAGRQDYAIGLTCAACHTGQILYKGVGLRIDGAPAMIDLPNLERIIGLSICYTDTAVMKWWRGPRFADAVLDAKGLTGKEREEARKEIRDRLTKICDDDVKNPVFIANDILKRRQQTHAEEGFGRLDALNRIGNQVFHENFDGFKKEPDVEKVDGQPKSDPKPALPGDLSKEALESNFAAYTAPVSFPALWDVPHFVWAQYDASILNPAIRNIGEAMGVAAAVTMAKTADGPALFSSSVDVKAIAKIEDMLRGSEHPLDGKLGFKGLQAPKWDEAASKVSEVENNAWKPVDTAKAERGKGLYATHCAECHRLPPNDTSSAATDTNSFWHADNWETFGSARLYQAKEMPVSHIGTDPEQARILTQRQIQLPKNLGVDIATEILERCGMADDPALKTSYALNLMAVVKRVEQQYFADRPEILPAERAAMESPLPNCANPRVFVPAETADPDRPDMKKTLYLTEPHYRPRPLDGVWATAPYLHNGSVPTLFHLLTPQNDRPKTFCVGPMDYDPEKVGLTYVEPPQGEKPICADGMTTFDALQRGNSNLGHSFEAAAGVDKKDYPAGVIGPLLNDNQRYDLIEYLKSL